MTKEQKIIRAKVGLLELAKPLGNVSQACKRMGYSRDSVSRFKELYDTGGELALQELTRKKPLLANRTAPEIEALILELSLEQPAFGQIRIANEIRQRGHMISPDLAGGRARGVAALFFRDPFVALTSVLPGMAGLAALVHFALRPNPARSRPEVAPEDIEVAIDPAEVLGAGGEEIEAKLKGKNDLGGQR